MGFELHVEVDQSQARQQIFDGWRGIVDFGEVWTETDRTLWLGPGAFPAGKPLAYGVQADGDGSGTPGRMILRFLFLDERRPVMAPDVPFVLRDGGTQRAVGRILPDTGS